jgi:hypothetical protein
MRWVRNVGMTVFLWLGDTLFLFGECEDVAQSGTQKGADGNAQLEDEVRYTKGSPKTVRLW